MCLIEKQVMHFLCAYANMCVSVFLSVCMKNPKYPNVSKDNKLTFLLTVRFVPYTPITKVLVFANTEESLQSILLHVFPICP